MKVICSRTALVEALSNVSRAASQRSPLRVIEGVLLKADEKGLYMCCYDLELGISKTIPAEVSENGEVVLSLKLCDYARRMSDTTITIECDEKYAVHISSGYASYDIIGMPASDFPELPKIEAEHTVTVKEGRLRSLISQTSYAISSKQNMPTQYSGELFELSDNNLNLVALDGFRVAISKETIENKGEHSFIVPGKTIAEITKLLSDGEEDVEVTTAQKNIVFSIKGYSLISRLIAGTFMNYRAAISDVGQYTLKAKTSDFISALERMSLIITEADRSPVCCLFKKSSVSFLCETDISRAVDNISCASDIDDELEMGFNNKYMLDALRAADTDEVKLLIHNDPHKPIQILPPDEDTFRFLLMPVILRPGMFKKDAETKASAAGQKPEYSNPPEEEIDEPDEYDPDYNDDIDTEE